MKHIKISSGWLYFLTAIQGTSVLLTILGVYEPVHFSVEHEDAIFIMLLVGSAITQAIEDVGQKLNQKETK